MTFSTLDVAPLSPTTQGNEVDISLPSFIEIIEKTNIEERNPSSYKCFGGKKFASCFDS